MHTLPDFSHAGYHRGEAPLPHPPAAANVCDFGAKGDGQTDDTAAFKAAIAATTRGAILIPAGRYVISDVLDIRKPGIILRGVGPAKTTLYFSKYLNDVRPDWGATTSGQRTSNYSWSGGFIWIKGDYQSAPLTEVVGAAEKGAQSVAVRSADRLQIGQTIDLYQQDTPQNTLAADLYGGDPGDTSKLLGSTHTSLTAKIVKIESGATPVITLDRTLRCNVRPEWKPVIRQFAPTVTECGVEDLRIEFPNVPYAGHFKELGHNPVSLEAVADCWVRNVEIVNADSGPMIKSRFCTITGITFKSDRQPDPEQHTTGHHGIYFYDDDNLFSHFVYQQKFIHDISVSKSAGNVICDGSGIDICFDHHKRAPYANLFTNIDIGEGTRPWMCGGGGDLGKHTAAGETFWNIRSKRPLPPPPNDFGPSGQVIVVADPPAGIPNLYADQLAKRWVRK